MKLLSDLFANLCILGMLLFTSNLLTTKRKGFISPGRNVYRKLHFGVNMGLIGIILMYYTIQFNSTILDLRQIPVVVAAIYGGAFASIVAAIMIAIGRMILFDINNSSVYASVLIIIVGVCCGGLSKLQWDLRKKWLVMNVSNLVLTSIVFIILMSDWSVLINIFAGYWSVTLAGGFIILHLMEYLRHKKEQFQAAEKNAATDFLTGLNNVRRFEEVLKESIKKADKHHEQVSFILADIDYFKQINDKFGHPSGDEVLKQLSEVLIDACRSIDIVSRNGGEEFSIILPSCSKDQAREVAERIRHRVETQTFILPDGSHVNITVSLGISTYRETTFNQENLIKQADDCLYQAKTTGRNRLVQAS